jgi:hypothetical protein
VAPEGRAGLVVSARWASATDLVFDRDPSDLTTVGIADREALQYTSNGSAIER